MCSNRFCVSKHLCTNAVVAMQDKESISTKSTDYHSEIVKLLCDLLMDRPPLHLQFVAPNDSDINLFTNKLLITVIKVSFISLLIGFTNSDLK